MLLKLKIVKKFPFLLLALCSRKPSLKDKVFPSPSKAPVVKGKTQSPGLDDGGEGSPSKVTKSWSFTEKNRGPKQAFKARGSTSRQNSEGEGTAHSTEHLTTLIKNKELRCSVVFDTNSSSHIKHNWEFSFCTFFSSHCLICILHLQLG